jgi:sigma-B regulation protein RsbU (phosphoserine phosphatase)
VVAANAGHEYPIIKHADRGFEILKDRHGFVIGGMSGLKYRDYEFVLEPGDALFLYTDGVPEATDAEGNMYGTQNLLETLNRVSDSSARSLLEAVHQDVERFVGNAPQFDDLTMLALKHT